MNSNMRFLILMTLSLTITLCVAGSSVEDANSSPQQQRTCSAEIGKFSHNKIILHYT